jgi:hypothetical protein
MKLRAEYTRTFGTTAQNKALYKLPQTNSTISISQFQKTSHLEIPDIKFLTRNLFYVVILHAELA